MWGGGRGDSLTLVIYLRTANNKNNNNNNNIHIHIHRCTQVHDQQTRSHVDTKAF